jgi:hypothetical protein
MRYGWIGVILLVLAACTPQTADPADAVEKYLQAKVSGDAETIRALLCPDMEQFLERETLSFSSVDGATIEDMTCSRVEGQDKVTCSGQIVATYGTEDTVFPLSNYAVAEVDGEWKWCGQTE